MFALNDELGEFSTFSFLWNNLIAWGSSMPWYLEEIVLKTLIRSSIFGISSRTFFSRFFCVYPPPQVFRLFDFVDNFHNLYISSESINLIEILKTTHVKLRFSLQNTWLECLRTVEGTANMERLGTVAGRGVWATSGRGWDSGTEKDTSRKLGGLEIKPEI